jgi:Flp pilus assembly protein TadB
LSEAVRSRLADLGEEVFPPEQQMPEALGALVKADAEKWWPIIKELRGARASDHDRCRARGRQCACRWNGGIASCTRKQSACYFWGIVGAVLLSVVLAAIAVKVLAIVGVTLVGGLLFLWVCWKLARDLRRSEVRASGMPDAVSQKGQPSMLFWGAVIADR